MKKNYLFSLGLLVSLLTLSSFNDDPGNRRNKINGHEYVDLGLSVKWATCNVGASSPEESGGYYAWGETEEKEIYDFSTYKWCDGSAETMTKYCTGNSCGKVDNKVVLDPQDDVAYVKWGRRWRMPTVAEIAELHSKCSWEWVTLNGVKGYNVTGPNGNSIFIPAVGRRDGSCLDLDGSSYYWSSSLGGSFSLGNISLGNHSYSAFDLVFDSDCPVFLIGSRFYGHCVRPVCE